MHNSKEKLLNCRGAIARFLCDNLFLELHPDKSRIIFLSRGVDFVGFRNFHHFRLLRKRNIRNMENKIKSFGKGVKSFGSLIESYHGWQAYARWANTHKLRNKVKRDIIDSLWDRV